MNSLAVFGNRSGDAERGQLRDAHRILGDLAAPAEAGERFAADRR